MRIAHVNVTVYGRFAPLTLKVRDHVLITTTQKTVSTLPEQTGIGIGTGAFYSKRPIRKPKWMLNM